jgi:LmbE family N-acetylglucosaminyl deacetylase
MHRVYLSPHFDDAVFSCGGLIWQDAHLSQPGPAPVILTVCAGEIPPGSLSPFAEMLHTRWKTGLDAVVERRKEDLRACARLGARPLHYNLPDCIYRKLTGTDDFLIQAEEDLFRPLPEEELPLAGELADRLYADVPHAAALMTPLAAGGHIDHRLVRCAAELLASRRQDISLCYYADVPYVLQSPQELEALKAEGWIPGREEISPPALLAWTAAAGAYRSQMSTFWPDEQTLGAAIFRYAGQGGGRLWGRAAGFTPCV